MKRIAIIGGGPAGLAAAFELTADGRGEDYDVTIYQQGWRLGGKCTSGRNQAAGYGKRIEEHGLHVFFGSYANTRRILDRCYAELAAGPDPYAFDSFDAAFEPVDDIVLGQRADKRWSFVKLRFPRDRAPVLNFGDFVSEALRWAARGLEQLVTTWDAGGAEDRDARWSDVQPLLETLGLQEPPQEERIAQLTRGASRLHRGLAEIFLDTGKAAAAQLTPIPLLEQFAALAAAALPRGPDEPAEVHFFRDTLDLLLAALQGIWVDDVLNEGFDSINGTDLAAWLQGHGLELEADPLDWPALLRAVYDGCFAFEGGDPGKPRIAAGRALQGAVRCLFHYEGAALYRPRSCMSDAVIGPLARVLEQRGVTVRYLNAVQELRPSADGRRIEALGVVQQANRQPAGATPSTDLPTGRGRDAPSLLVWSTAPPDGVIPARAGRRRPSTVLEQEINPFGRPVRTIEAADEAAGFDWVVLAVPPEVQRQICEPLRGRDARYDAMLDNAASVMTQAGQLYLERPAAELGQDFSPASLCSCFVEPLDTVADMAHVAGAEHWAGTADVRHIAYLCGVLPDAGIDSQASADAAARAELVRFLDEDVGELWPHSVGADGKGFKWDLLVPPRDPGEEDVLARQYVRANWSPTERYVLTLPGSVEHRLPACGTTFENLVLAGDWTANGLDAGCLEAAVTSGRLAARGICGAPLLDDISGVDGPPGFPNRGPGATRRQGPADGVVDRIEQVAGAAGSVLAGALRLAWVTVGRLRQPH